jgi:hypothetical protein
MTQIEGNPTSIPDTEFRPKIQRCLDLLRSKASAYATWFNAYDLKIRASQRSGANFGDNAIDIARLTFNASDTWLASVIIHEAVHFCQFRSGHYQAGTPAETEANRYQLGVLQLLGAPSSEMAHMRAQDGTHADLNGDGVYDERDYQMRGY